MEDPVYDLNWNEAEEVSAALVSLTRGGRTLICTLSSPTTTVFEAFDLTLLIGSGQQLYFGSRESVMSYFQNIGFELKRGQSAPEFLIDIASERSNITKDKGSVNSPMRKSVAVNLSLEDLADLARSLNNATKLSNASKSNAALSVPKTAAEAMFSKEIKTIKSNQNGIPMIYITPALQPTGRVMAARGFAIIFSEQTSFLMYFLRAVIAGFVIGSLWWRIQNDAYQIKMNLFACTYIFVNLALVDLFDGLHKRFVMFGRERTSGSSSSLAYWLSDPAPSFVLNTICCLFISFPVYLLADLRPGIEYFGFFYLVLLGSVYCNTGLACLLSTLTSSASTSRLIFNGVVMPLQILFSGFLILLPSMANWYRWISCICPMSYYLASLLNNDFNGNEDALSNVSYSDIEDAYGYHIDKYVALFVILGIGAFYKLAWLFALFSYESICDSNNFRRRDGGKMSRRIISAGLRWRSGPSSSSLGRGGSSGISKGQYVENTDEYLGGLEENMFNHTIKASSQGGDDSSSSTSWGFFGRKSSGTSTDNRMKGMGNTTIVAGSLRSSFDTKDNISIGSRVNNLFSGNDIALFQDEMSAYHEL